MVLYLQLRTIITVVLCRHQKRFLDWLREVNSPYFKVCLDTGNFKDLYPSIEKTIKIAAFVHTKLYVLDKNGVEKKLDYERIFKILKKAKYTGYLSIEFEGEENEFTAMKRGCSYLRRMINKYAK